jgi:L-seryl-tRNA(Ser) seleniumtransferase
VADRRRALPSVDRLLRRPDVAALGDGHPRALLTRAVRQAVDAARRSSDTAVSDAEWTARVSRALDDLTLPTLRRVVNATGVVLHTNLGRAPLADAASAAVRDAGAAYSTLEYDVASGARGSRHVHGAALLCELTGAADAMVVNNAASALVLAIATLASGGAVVVSRGELIEIGGGFRIPEIMETGGATLREVGTTNRTRLADYEKAVARGQEAKRPRGVARKPGSSEPVALLKVHRSNFRLEGFTAEVGIRELVALGKRKRVPVIYDLGSGLMLDLAAHGLPGEPTLPEAARSGATAVVASGDKLLGGPQAGLLLGGQSFIRKARAHPLARAIRADKLTLAGLAATLALYREPELARRAIPVLRMLTSDSAELHGVAERLAAALPARAQAAVVPTRAAVGGGSYPGTELDSFAVALAPPAMTAVALAAALRAREVPVIVTVAKGRVLLDVRTLLPGDDALIARAVAGIVT